MIITNEVKVFQYLAHTTALFSYSPSTGIKLSLTYNFFQNSMLGMGSERHFKYFEANSKPEPEVCTACFVTVLNCGCRK